MHINLNYAQLNIGSIKNVNLHLLKFGYIVFYEFI